VQGPTRTITFFTVTLYISDIWCRDKYVRGLHRSCAAGDCHGPTTRK